MIVVIIAIAATGLTVMLVKNWPDSFIAKTLVSYFESVKRNVSGTEASGHYFRATSTFPSLLLPR